MDYTKDTNAIFAKIKRDCCPAAKMQCDLEVISMMNAANTAVEAYNMGRHAAMCDRRFLIANSVVNGLFQHQYVVDSEAEDKVIEQAIRVAKKLTKRLDDIEQKEFEDFKKI